MTVPTSLLGPSARLSVRLNRSLLASCALLLLHACGDGDPSGLQWSRDAEAVTISDDPANTEPDDEEDDEPAVKPKPVELPPTEVSDSGDAGGPDSAGNEDASTSDAESEDAATSTDADAPMDASEVLDAEMDAGAEQDAALDSALALDTSVPPDTSVSADTGACANGGDGCHPLAGRYVARTQLYARQRSAINADEVSIPLDLVSKGVLLSLVDIDGSGNAKEHLCLLEIGGQVKIDGADNEIASWVKPSASQAIPDTTLPLTLTNGRYTRALSAHKAYYGWLPDSCSSSTALPAAANDCRVRDTDLDSAPGGTMQVRLAAQDAKPTDPQSEDGLVSLYVAAQLSFGWSLPATAAPRLVGTISGGFTLAELGRASGPLAAAVGPIVNSACPETLGHIELVRDATATCASLIAGRAGNVQTAGVFDVGLDAPTPATSACPEAECARDSDSDGTPDCRDTCPQNAPKTAPGACGCATADTNSDSDTVPNCLDGCPQDGAKTAPGACGCGVAETNSDNDSLPDCTDACDNDPNKTVAGVCGCGVAETNSDGDALPDCTDGCDNDRNKTAPGICGCGTADTNSDNDSLPDCSDACDNDANKTVAGVCGCGVPETNSDNDSRPDCTDECDADPAKVVPGQCGCGIRDADLNGDGSIDCSDSCPNDPAKVAPGLCGCGVADTNTDGDAQPDCNETCDADVSKVAPGQCGCGVADTDSDNDRVANCNDACPNDPLKTASTLCGCGVPDTDSDSDGAPDCTDQCDNNPALTVAGACGCTACVPTNPLVGTYAVRSALFGKARNGTAVTTSKSLNYALITVTQNSDQSLRFSEQGCWTQSLPNPSDPAPRAYSWSKATWVQAIPPSVQNLVSNSNGSYTRNIPLKHFGWDPARQPASCTATSTPVAPWGGSSWGTTCSCNTPASAMPPYDKNVAPYDCRLVDADGDGQPGLSAIAATGEPSSPEAGAPGLGGTAYAAVDASGTWLITPASNGKHMATISDTSVSQLVGCTGAACSFLAATPPGNASCPQALNRAQFVPVTETSDTCTEIIAARDTLFVQNADPLWPDVVAACPAP